MFQLSSIYSYGFMSLRKDRRFSTFMNVLKIYPSALLHTLAHTGGNKWTQ